MTLGRVLVIEDDSFTRSLLAGALAGNLFDVFPGFSARYALETAAAQDIDVAILDLDLGGGPTGIDIAHALRASLPSIGIVLLTSYSDPRLSRIDEMPIPVGTRYVTKSQLHDLNELTTIVLSAKSAPLSSINPALRSRCALTNHQIDVLRLIAEGLSNFQIALKLSISEKAVENTVTRIADVLDIHRDAGLNPRVQLVRAYSRMSGNQLPDIS